MVRVAALQLSSQANVAENLRVVGRLIERVVAAEAELVVLPEGFAFLGPEIEKIRQAESWGEGGPIQDFLCRTAQDHHLSIIAGGMPEKSEDPSRPYNTSVAIDGDGRLVGKYRKIHLFDADLDDGTKLNESSASMAGGACVVVELRDLRIGLAICYDLRFPQLFASQRAQDAQLLTVPSAFTATTGAAHWHVLQRARAIENQCYVVAPAQWGTHPGGRRTFGHTLIVDPWGRMSAELQEGVGLVVADVETETVDATRRQMPIEQHRRPFR